MKVYTYTKAREQLSNVLDEADKGPVVVTRRAGRRYLITPMNERAKSPLDVPGIKTDMTTKDILSALRESRSRTPEIVKRRRVK
jgi:prevent-host-death family protein